VTQKLRQGAVVLLFSFLFTGHARGGLVIQFTRAADGGTVVDFTGSGDLHNATLGSTKFVIEEKEFVQGTSFSSANSNTGSLTLLSASDVVTGTKHADITRLGDHNARDSITIVWNTPLGGEKYIANLQAVFSVGQLPHSQLTLGSYSLHSASDQPFDSVSLMVVTSIPEPSSIVIISGLAAIAVATRRRKLQWNTCPT
jgi:hypothetical protein